MSALEITVLVYGYGLFLSLAVGLCMLNRSVLYRRNGARIILTCWAWPAQAVLLAIFTIRRLLVYAEWKE